MEGGWAGGEVMSALLSACRRVVVAGLEGLLAGLGPEELEGKAGRKLLEVYEKIVRGER